MQTRTGRPAGYDPSQFPAFAVTVDIVILTMIDGEMQVLLIRRGEDPFKGMWAIPGGFKRPTETLDEAAQRELVEETGVDTARLLAQFGAYGDPDRDPRMNVVTVGYLAVEPPESTTANRPRAAMACLAMITNRDAASRASAARSERTTISGRRLPIFD